MIRILMNTEMEKMRKGRQCLKLRTNCGNENGIVSKRTLYKVSLK
jgi:hypothetical protein